MSPAGHDHVCPPPTCRHCSRPQLQGFSPAVLVGSQSVCTYIRHVYASIVRKLMYLCKLMVWSMGNPGNVHIAYLYLVCSMLCGQPLILPLQEEKTAVPLCTSISSTKRNPPFECWWQTPSIGHYGACEEGALFLKFHSQFWRGIEPVTVQGMVLA